MRTTCLTIAMVILLSVPQLFAQNRAAIEARHWLAERDIPFTTKAFLDRAKKRDDKGVKYFLAAGMDVNVKDRANRTALMWAAKAGHLRTVKELLAAGARVDVRDEFGSTAWSLAMEFGHNDVARLLKRGPVVVRTASQPVAVPSPPPIRVIQARLQADGFDPGPIDGILGPRTKRALSRYQSVRGLSVTGILDADTRKILLAP